MERQEDMSEPEQQALLKILVRHINETLTRWALRCCRSRYCSSMITEKAGTSSTVAA